MGGTGSIASALKYKIGSCTGKANGRVGGIAGETGVHTDTAKPIEGHVRSSTIVRASAVARNQEEASNAGGAGCCRSGTGQAGGYAFLASIINCYSIAHAGEHALTQGGVEVVCRLATGAEGCVLAIQAGTYTGLTLVQLVDVGGRGARCEALVVEEVFIERKGVASGAGGRGVDTGCARGLTNLAPSHVS